MYPRISVITINYNNIKGLKNTIDSVFAQTFSDFEYIVIDGGSDDGSVDVLKSISETKFPFTWISEPDTGIYNAMNKGILRSEGDYCFFLNSGDLFASDNVLKNAIKSNPGEDIVFGNMYVCQNGKVVEKCKGKNTLTFMDLYMSYIKHQATFIKRKLFETYGLYDESKKIVSDWEFFLKVLGFHSASYKFIDEFITCFDSDGISYNSPSITLHERNEILDNNIPPMILADYRYYEKYQFLKPALRNPLSLFMLRVIAKITKEIEKLSGEK